MPKQSTKTSCSVDDCVKPVLKRGFCDAHYQWARTYGLIQMRPKMSVEDRFWAKVDKNGPIPAHRPELGPCWVWTASCNPEGYGHIMMKAPQRLIKAHRFAYEQAHGPIPFSLEIDHLCRNHPCVRSSHLEAVTHAENMRRGVAGQHWRAKTHCPQGHPYDEANTYFAPDGARNCRVCRRLRSQRRRAQHQEVTE